MSVSAPQSALERGGFLRPDALNNSNKLELFVFANDKQGQARSLTRASPARIACPCTHAAMLGSRGIAREQPPSPAQAWLAARLDNLGKGASGAAVQNMNLALGLDEGAGL